MMRGKLIKVATILALATGIRWDGKVAGQTQTPPAVVPSFKASVDMVRIAAIVRDRKGRFVADLTARDEHLRSTPLAWAAKFGQLDMVRFLLERGAPKSLPDDPPWATPLAWALKRGHEKVADLLR
mgnify:CR=1 FL=1